MAIREQLTPNVLIELYAKKKMSLSEIGKMYRVSRQRVHQLKKEYEDEHGKIGRSITVDVLTLKHYLDQGWTAKKIAEKYEVKPSKIARLIRTYREKLNEGIVKIPLKRKMAGEMVKREILVDLYAVKLLTDGEIGEKFHLSASTVGMLRKKYKIKTNRTKALRKLPIQLTKEKFERYYKKEGMTLQDIADKMKCNVVAIIELKREYRITR